MFRKIATLGILIAFVSISSLAFAEDVYVTKNGHKYHKEICRLIKNKKPEKVTKADALDKKLEPCGLCYKEDLSKAVEGPIQPKVSSKKKK